MEISYKSDALLTSNPECSPLHPCGREVYISNCRENTFERAVSGRRIFTCQVDFDAATGDEYCGWATPPGGDRMFGNIARI